MLNNFLLARDSRLITTLESICANVGIMPTVCSESAEAASMLVRCKFYGAIVDCAEPHAATEVLSRVRKSSSSRNAISVVIGDDSAGVLGGTFVLRRPVALEELTVRTLRAAKGLMLNEFRRYFRYPVQLPVLIRRDSGGELQATSINISHRGLAVQIPDSNLIAARDAVRTRLTLPGSGACIEMNGKVTWTDMRGRAGIHCQSISPRDQQRLEEWLAPHLPQN